MVTRVIPIQVDTWISSELLFHGVCVCVLPLCVYFQAPLERRSMSYEDFMRELMDDEQQYIRHLNLILKLFREPFLARKDLFIPHVSSVCVLCWGMHSCMRNIVRA